MGKSSRGKKRPRSSVVPPEREGASKTASAHEVRAPTLPSPATSEAARADSPPVGLPSRRDRLAGELAAACVATTILLTVSGAPLVMLQGGNPTVGHPALVELFTVGSLGRLLFGLHHLAGLLLPLFALSAAALQVLLGAAPVGRRRWLALTALLPVGVGLSCSGSLLPADEAAGALALRAHDLLALLPGLSAEDGRRLVAETGGPAAVFQRAYWIHIALLPAGWMLAAVAIGPRLPTELDRGLDSPRLRSGLALALVILVAAALFPPKVGHLYQGANAHAPATLPWFLLAAAAGDGLWPSWGGWVATLALCGVFLAGLVVARRPRWPGPYRLLVAIGLLGFGAATLVGWLRP
ncbi:MAG: hypothetical protein IT371_24995 [Deltaproteobacteria bacterium]|nr:hypothetical protein [Deltaproteobacteria bacterium]